MGGYRDNPPAADSSKVIISDTDHLWGIGGNPAWVWKSFLRGMHPIFMDPYKGVVLTKGFGDNRAEPIRRSMGHVLDWSRRVDLASMTPQNDLASSRYCLAEVGSQYLVYVPVGEAVQLELPADRRNFVWFDAATGNESNPESLQYAGGSRTFQSPFSTDSLLYVYDLST